METCQDLRNIPNLLIVEQVNDASPWETVIFVVHVADCKELSRWVWESSFLIAAEGAN